MIFALHGQTTFHTNIVHDIRIAKEAGFDALEIITEKLLRYLDAGLDAEDLLPVFQKHAILPVCIDILGDIERIEPTQHRQLLEEAERLCVVAKTLQCPTIQINPFSGLAARPWDEIIRLTARNIADIADIGQQYGIRFQLEGAAWTPIHSLAQCLEVIDEAERDNVGLVLDFWHLWASRRTTPDEIAKLDRSLIYGVHFCDGLRPESGEEWPDETLLRGGLPGDGDIPLQEWVAAVRATGFDGVCSAELLGPKSWEADPLEIAQDMKKRLEHYFQDFLQ
ncbi:MAG: sugar phosphate isomerase/epimerase [bacterium]|nr:sugar phosphate isomerase/epimerase [bacterium]